MPQGQHMISLMLLNNLLEGRNIKKSLVKLHTGIKWPQPSRAHGRLGKRHWKFGKSEPSSLLLQETVLNKSVTWLMLYGYLNYFLGQKNRSPSRTRARHQNLQIPACSWVHLKWVSARDKIEHQWFDGTWQQNSEVHIRFLCYLFQNTFMQYHPPNYKAPSRNKSSVHDF
jgi:hypothetical protein